MKPYRRGSPFFYRNDHALPLSHPTITEIPIDSSVDAPVSISVRLPTSAQSAAATRIQSAYRAHTVRRLVKMIYSVDAEASRLERLIQRQDTVDRIRRDDRERLRLNEALMALLLRLDSVPGVDPAVRDLRRNTSRRIVGLQEIADAVSNTRVPDWEGFLGCWDEAVEGIENDVCREGGGGEELERFCAEKLGFRCLLRFLREA